LKLEKKKEIIEHLHGCLEKTKIVILADFKGTNVATITKLRRELKNADVVYKVVKNKLLKRAAEGTDAELLKDYFKGPSAIALNNYDPIIPAKILCDFSEKDKNFKIKAGAMNGKLLTIDEIKVLSLLPSREILLGQVLSAFNGVPTSLVRALADVPRRLINVLNGLKEQKETT
jgi:large subunit ribosomal protein L10